MNKNRKLMTLAALATFVLSCVAYGESLGTLTPADRKFQLNNYMGQAGANARLGTLVNEVDQVDGDSTVAVRVGQHAKRMVRLEYDTGKTTLAATGDYDLGVRLPPATLVTNAYFEIIRQFASGSSAARLSIHCGQDSYKTQILQTANLNASTVGTTSFTNGFGQVLPGQNPFMKFEEGCMLGADVTSAAFTAGKIVFFIEYVVSE